MIINLCTTVCDANNESETNIVIRINASKKCEYIHFIPNCFKIVFVWLFFSSELLSKRHTMESLALDSIPDKYTSTTE